VIGLAVALASVGCSWLQGGTRPHLGIENGTTLDVIVFVNNVQVAVSRPNGPSPSIDSGALPALPWLVEARCATGRVLTSMQVAEGQVWSTTRPDGGMSQQGTFGRVDLSCGRLTIWAGDFAPSGPAPDPNAGEPGDCVP
jgi:hypothetical protein